MSQIVIISGPPGAGKSAVAEALCERYDRTVRLETDAFYGSIRMGYLPPWRAGSERQNHMVSRAVARAASAYAEDEYGVFVDGVIGAHLLPDYIDELKGALDAVQFVVLLPSLEELSRRAFSRDKAIVGFSPDDLARMHAMFSDEGAFPACRIDTGGMSVHQAADAVMDAAATGACLVAPPE